MKLFAKVIILALFNLMAWVTYSGILSNVWMYVMGFLFSLCILYLFSAGVERGKIIGYMRGWARVPSKMSDEDATKFYMNSFHLEKAEEELKEDPDDEDIKFAIQDYKTQLDLLKFKYYEKTT